MNKGKKERDPETIKKECLRVRVTESEHETLRNYAEHADMTLSEFIRQQITGNSVNLTYTTQATFPDVTEALKEFGYELSKIGTNINQIAHRLNGGGELDGEALDCIIRAQTDIGAIRHKMADIEEIVNTEFKTFSTEGEHRGNSKTHEQ